MVPEMKRTLASRIYWRVVALDEGHKVKLPPPLRLPPRRRAGLSS